MPFSASKGFLFLHVPKAAGTSIRAALGPWLSEPSQSRWNKLASRLRLTPVERRFLYEHASAREARWILGTERFERWFKFAFVRNPYERLVSQYRFLLGNPRHKRHGRVLALGSFPAYARFELARGRFHQLPQIADRDGRLLVDFLGRYERLAADFALLRARLELPLELPHLNRSPGSEGDWRALYDAPTRRLVEGAFAREAERLEYRFDP
jgi:hypothetical protein